MLDNQDRTSYLNHLRAEHRRFHSILTRAQLSMNEFEKVERKASTELMATLQQMRDELAHHFAEEEEGSCLEEAVARCPRLSSEARRIQAEHQQLLESLDRLLVQGAVAESTSQELQASFHAICQQLLAHEAAESHVLEEGLGESVNE